MRTQCHAQLLELAEQHGGLRAIEGAGGYGAGLARHLRDTDEWSSSSTARSGPHAAPGPSPM